MAATANRRIGELVASLPGDLPLPGSVWGAFYGTFRAHVLQGEHLFFGGEAADEVVGSVFSLPGYYDGTGYAKAVIEGIGALWSGVPCHWRPLAPSPAQKARYSLRSHDPHATSA